MHPTRHICNHIKFGEGCFGFFNCCCSFLTFRPWTLTWSRKAWGHSWCSSIVWCRLSTPNSTAIYVSICIIHNCSPLYQWNVALSLGHLVPPFYRSFTYKHMQIWHHSYVLNDWNLYIHTRNALCAISNIHIFIGHFQPLTLRCQSTTLVPAIIWPGENSGLTK